MQRGDGAFSNTLVSDTTLDSNRGHFMLKGQIKTFAQRQAQAEQQHNSGARMTQPQHNFDNQIASQTSILQQI